MPITTPARTAWSVLSEPWQHAIGMAWESYRLGGIAVGAVLTDGAGEVLGRGRNQRSAGGLLAHAELEALAAVPAAKDRARDTRLYTTLHPCPMCLGATVVARIGELHFGAYDPTWLGIERLPELNDEVARRWPPIHGPLPGPVGEWLAVLPALNTGGSLVRALTETAPRRAALARLVAARYAGELPERPGDALAAAWDLLT